MIDESSVMNSARCIGKDSKNMGLLMLGEVAEALQRHAVWTGAKPKSQAMECAPPTGSASSAAEQLKSTFEIGIRTSMAAAISGSESMDIGRASYSIDWLWLEALGETSSLTRMSTTSMESEPTTALRTSSCGRPGSRPVSELRTRSLGQRKFSSVTRGEHIGRQLMAQLVGVAA